MGKLLQNRSAQVLLLSTLYLLFSSFLPTSAHRFFYTISLFIKDVLLLLLPITVAIFIAHSISSFEKKAPLFLCALLLFEVLSNSLSVWYAYGCGHLFSMQSAFSAVETAKDSFHPLWRLGLSKPLWWSVQKGTLIGAFLGLVLAFLQGKPLIFLRRGKGVMEWILTRLFGRLIPLFVLGFLAKIYQTQVFSQLFSQYSRILVALIFFLFLYIAFLFLLANGFSLRGFWQSLRNLLPAAGMALSSGCSLSTMPLTIEGTAKNLKNPDLAKALIPATTNVQQVGDCIANAFLCFLIYHSFFHEPPSLITWGYFSGVFILARFATAAVIGGAIFLMLPIYETYLHFTPEMIAIILAFNVLLDPIITSTNVICNGALCQLFEKGWRFGFAKSVYKESTR